MVDSLLEIMDNLVNRKHDSGYTEALVRSSGHLYLIERDPYRMPINVIDLGEYGEHGEFDEPDTCAVFPLGVIRNFVAGYKVLDNLHQHVMEQHEALKRRYQETIEKNAAAMLEQKRVYEKLLDTYAAEHDLLVERNTRIHELEQRLNGNKK